MADNANEGKGDLPAAVPTGPQNNLRHMRRRLATEVKVVGVGPVRPNLVLEKRRRSVAGENGDDINAVPPDFEPQRIAESPNREFAGGIDGVPRRGNRPEDAADVDDLAAVLLAQDWQDGLGATQNCEEIQFHYALGIGVFQVGDRSAQPDAGIVDQDIDAAKSAQRRGDNLGRSRRLGNVGRAGKELELRIFRGYLPEHFRPARNQDNPRSGAAKRQRGFFANPTGRAGDDHNLIVKVRIHRAQGYRNYSGKQCRAGLDYQYEHPLKSG